VRQECHSSIMRVGSSSVRVFLKLKILFPVSALPNTSLKGYFRL